MAGGFLSVPVKDEQEAVERLRVFLVGSIGWSVAQDVTDSAADRDVVLQSDGETDTLNSNTRYIRLRGTANCIYLHTYETFTSVSTNTGEVSDATYGLLTVEGDLQGFFLRAVADLERVVLHVETYDSVQRIAYVGRINSYYSAAQHPYPNLVKGGQDSLYDFYYSAALRNSWMVAADNSVEHYYCVDVSGYSALVAGQSSDRDGSMFISAPVLVCDGASANKELVGEPRGVYRVPREVSRHSMFIPVSGDPYIIFQSNDVCLAVGPVTASGVDVLPSL